MKKATKTWGHKETVILIEVRKNYVVLHTAKQRLFWVFLHIWQNKKYFECCLTHLTKQKIFWVLSYTFDKTKNILSVVLWQILLSIWQKQRIFWVFSCMTKNKWITLPSLSYAYISNTSGDSPINNSLAVVAIEMWSIESTNTSQRRIVPVPV